MIAWDCALFGSLRIMRRACSGVLGDSGIETEGFWNGLPPSAQFVGTPPRSLEVGQVGCDVRWLDDHASFQATELHSDMPCLERYGSNRFQFQIERMPNHEKPRFQSGRASVPLRPPPIRKSTVIGASVQFARLRSTGHDMVWLAAAGTGTDESCMTRQPVCFCARMFQL